MGRKKSIGRNTSEIISKEKNIKYKIILLFNGNKRKILLETKDRSFVMEEYSKLLSSSRKVKIKRETISANGIHPLHTEIILIKSIGKKSAEVPEDRLFEENWKIIKRDDYAIEEKYSVYGEDEKLTADEIISHLNKINTSHRELGVCNNKVIVYNETFFDLIVAKCPEDAERLAPYIYENNGKHKKFFYRGVYKGYDKRDIMDIIQEETGWNRLKVSSKYTDGRKKSK